VRAPDRRYSWAAHGDNKQPESAIDAWDHPQDDLAPAVRELAADFGESSMRLAIARRAIAAAAAITLLTIPSAFAESVAASFDLLDSSQNTRDLGTVQPGADVPLDVYFTLTCSGTNHVNSNQAVRLSSAVRTAPTGGGYSVGGLTFGLGSAWPVDGQPCPAGLPPTIGGPLHIIVTAPTEPGNDYRYFFSWNRAVTPASSNDVGVFDGTNPSITIFLDVPGGTVNTPPTLNLPADSVVEGNRTGGATAAYVVTASDAEDSVAPTPSCIPALGSLLPLGQNTISCSATDSGGLTANGSFKVTVVDTTDPTLSGMPGDISLTTSDPSGTTLTYSAPTASDIVDWSPAVACSPASGSKIPVGDTTVTCTATDDSGNAASASFVAHVTRLNTPPTLNLPADSTVEGNTTGGAAAAYVVTASDIEDAVAPTPSCSPALGSVLPLGQNTINCSATDSGGLTANGSFKISIQDTTPPTISGMPGDINLTTSDPSGTTLTYSMPTASDIVDASPAVNCAPASGSTIPVGDTTVSCTATDDSGNSASASFVAHVTRLHVTGATWEDPVGAAGGITVNGSRTIPVKVQLLLDGQAITGGAGLLTVVGCDVGAPVMTAGLDIQSNGRWMGHLDTSGLAAGCYRVTASVDGLAIGSFQMTVKADSGALAKPAKAKTKP